MPEQAVAAWFGPKGFASVVYGLLILEAGVEGADEMFHVVALVIFASILAHSSTDVPIAQAFARADSRRAAAGTGRPVDAGGHEQSGGSARDESTVFGQQSDCAADTSEPCGLGSRPAAGLLTWGEALAAHLGRTKIACRVTTLPKGRCERPSRPVLLMAP